MIPGFVFVWTVLVPAITHAQNAQGPTCGGKLCNPLKDGMGLQELVVYIVKDILVGLIAPIVITLALLWSGFQFVSAQGNDQKLAQAKTNFLYVIIGGVVLLGAYVILELVTNTVDQIIR